MYYSERNEKNGFWVETQKWEKVSCENWREKSRETQIPKINGLPVWENSYRECRNKLSHAINKYMFKMDNKRNSNITAEPHRLLILI